MTDKLVTVFKSARIVGTPAIAINTPDPAATIDQLRAGAIGKDKPIVIWDVCNGWLPGNQAGQKAIAEAMDQLGGSDAKDVTANPEECLMAATALPDGTVLFLINAHRYLADGRSGAPFVQALWNLRDAFKSSLRTVVLLGPSITLPPELGGDILALDEALPGEDELGEIVCAVLDAAEIPCKGAVKAQAVDALRGLAAFPAEQATAMAVTDKGGQKDFDPQICWDRKRKMISATPGLAVWQGGETLADVGGCDQIKRYVKMLLAGKEAPRVVVFIDEIEKAFAGATAGTGDSSGVSQGFLQQMLVYMQDAGASGMIFVGPPGAAKSAVGKAIGSEGKTPTIALDLGGMKDSLVGASESRLRMALKVIDAVGGGRALFVATCNKIATLPPELRRRFTMGTFFFDLPDAAEQEAIWNIYTRKFGLDVAQARPECRGWTGAEIRQACLLSYRLNIKLADTAQFIVPVAKSAADEIEGLRRQADRKFLSASREGIYTIAGTEEGKVPETRAKRAMAKEIA